MGVAADAAREAVPFVTRLIHGDNFLIFLHGTDVRADICPGRLLVICGHGARCAAFPLDLHISVGVEPLRVAREGL